MNKKQTGKLLKGLVTACRDKQFSGLSDKVAELPATTEILEDERLKESFVWSGLSNDLELVKAFLTLGLSINTEHKQNSILDPAVGVPNPDFLRALLDLGANPNHLDSHGASLLTYVSKVSRGVKMFHFRSQLLENLKMLTESSIHINTADMCYRTPLDYCCEAGWDAAAFVLLEKGAKLSNCFDSGAAILCDVVEGMDVKVLEILLRQEAAPEIAKNGGRTVTRTALEWAAKKGRPRHVEALIAAGVPDRLSDGRSARDVVRDAVKEREPLKKMLAEMGIKMDPNA